MTNIPMPLNDDTDGEDNKNDLRTDERWDRKEDNKQDDPLSDGPTRGQKEPLDTPDAPPDKPDERNRPQQQSEPGQPSDLDSALANPEFADAPLPSLSRNPGLVDYGDNGYQEGDFTLKVDAQTLLTVHYERETVDTSIASSAKVLIDLGQIGSALDEVHAYLSGESTTFNPSNLGRTLYDPIGTQRNPLDRDTTFTTIGIGLKF